MGSSGAQHLGAALIPAVNRLQDITASLGVDVGVDLPQVAVVGGQSSGKSSVLEALVGRAFLPRAPGICTRRPLVLQLVRDTSARQEWAEFLHRPGEKFTDFSAVRDEIVAETDREVGGTDVSDKQIRLRVHSPHVLTMTLVDLPGVTKVPVGNQPADIESKLRALINRYIKHETCIILAVTPANQDVANSDALQIARQVDPHGNRTLGVVTKCDLVDRGAESTVVEAVKGGVVPLRLGYVAVVNRGHKSVESDAPVREALAAEAEFFRRGDFATLKAINASGTPALAARLNSVLAEHIAAAVPTLREQANKRRNATLHELGALGAPPARNTAAEAGSSLLAALGDFAERVLAHLDGDATASGMDAELDEDEGDEQFAGATELYGGARVAHLFEEVFRGTLRNANLAAALPDSVVRSALANSQGTRARAALVAEAPFEALARKCIKRLQEPCLQCARMVRSELARIATRSAGAVLGRFPALEAAALAEVEGFLMSSLMPCEQQIRTLLAMECGYINTRHPNFVGAGVAAELVSAKARRDAEDAAAAAAADGTADGPYAKLVSHALSSASAERPSEGPLALSDMPNTLHAGEASTEAERMEIEVVRRMLESYYDIVVCTLCDLVPKAAMHFLVDKTRRELRQVLVSRLYKEESFAHLLAEDEAVAQRRRQLREESRALTEALSVLDNLPKELADGGSKPHPSAAAHAHAVTSRKSSRGASSGSASKQSGQQRQQRERERERDRSASSPPHVRPSKGVAGPPVRAPLVDNRQQRVALEAATPPSASKRRGLLGTMGF